MSVWTPEESVFLKKSSLLADYLNGEKALSFEELGREARQKGFTPIRGDVDYRLAKLIFILVLKFSGEDSFRIVADLERDDSGKPEGLIQIEFYARPNEKSGWIWNVGKILLVSISGDLSVKGLTKPKIKKLVASILYNYLVGEDDLAEFTYAYGYEVWSGALKSAKNKLRKVIDRCEIKFTDTE